MRPEKAFSLLIILPLSIVTAHGSETTGSVPESSRKLAVLAVTEIDDPRITDQDEALAVPHVEIGEEDNPVNIYNVYKVQKQSIFLPNSKLILLFSTRNC